MRYYCWFCHKSVSSELPDDSIIRAVMVCPECIEQKKVIIQGDGPPIQKAVFWRNVNAQ